MVVDVQPRVATGCSPHNTIPSRPLRLVSGSDLTRRAPEHVAALQLSRRLRFATDAAGELEILGHDRNALRVDGAEIGVLEEANEVRLRRLLEGDEAVRREARDPE